MFTAARSLCVTAALLLFAGSLPAQIFFTGNETAGNASLENTFYLVFYDQSSADGATILNQAPAYFYNSSTAGNATITNENDLTFDDDATAGNATITNSGTVRFNAYSTADSAKLINLPGGSIELDFINSSLTIGSLSGGGQIILGEKSLRLGALGRDDDLSAQIAGDGGSLTKVGSGVLALMNANTYTGGTTIEAGTLRAINPFGSATGSGTVTVAAGGTLDGDGTIEGFTTVQAGGVLAPGFVGSELTFTNGLKLEDGAILSFELGTTSDLLRVSGDTLIGSASAGGITLNLTAATGFTAATYTLIDFTDAYLSTFNVSDFTFGNTIDGYTYSLDLVGSALQLTATASAIPEPGTYAALAGLGALGLVLYRRRSRQR